MPKVALSSLFVLLTAGRDSAFLTTANLKRIILLVEISHINELFNAIYLQFLQRSSQTGEELTRQPDSHHRAIIFFLLPHHPSMVFWTVKVFVFYCFEFQFPFKGFGTVTLFGETFSVHCYDTYKTLLNSKLVRHHRMLTHR